MNDKDEILAQLDQLRSENNNLRYIIANSNLDCIYCQLPKADLGKCKSGFPGCGRMDDLMVNISIE